MLHSFAFGVDMVEDDLYSVVPLDAQFAHDLLNGKLPAGSFYQTITFIATDENGSKGVFIFVLMPDVEDFNAAMIVIDGYMEHMTNNPPYPFDPSLN